AEIAKKEKEIAKIVGFVKSKQAKLAGGFAEKAPAAVVEKERQSLEDLKAQLASNEEMLAKLRRAWQ
ncbi:MAG: hypothetical protein J6S27_08130, partial [Thermoguttaceae bacterium]|nr:hypothetical protein [Thermoguttaceae bacterium]